MSIPSIPSTIHKHDGHVEGHLNCIAIRHGWTRTFSMSPEEVMNLEYQTLERILELSTLKLRSLGALRIYVENPAGSRIYTKVRYWKDDGSLQSNLVKDFFEGRLRDGGIIRFEVRDGRERTGGVLDEEATVGADSQIGSDTPSGPAYHIARKANKKKSMSFDWFMRHRAGTAATQDSLALDHDQEHDGPSNKPPNNDARRPTSISRGGAIGFFELFISFAFPQRARDKLDNADNAEEAAPLQPRGDREAGHDASALRSRGSLRQRMTYSTSSPFFGTSTVRGTAGPRASGAAAAGRFKSDLDSGVDIDAEAKELPDIVSLPSPGRPRRSIPAGRFPEDVSPHGDDEILSASPAPMSVCMPTPPPERENTPTPSLPAKGLSRFRPFLQRSASSDTASSSPRKLNKQRRKEKDKDKRRAKDDSGLSAWKGADVVRRPEDAWAAVTASRSESALGHHRPHAPTPPRKMTDDPSSDSSATRVMSIGNLLDDDEDPFRG